MTCFEYYSPRHNLFGFGCRHALADALKDLGVKKALLVTDKTLVQIGIVGKVTEVLDAAGIAHVLFDEVKPNPTIANAEAGIAVLKQNSCDFLVSIGGGSAHDCAKAIAIVATNGGAVRDYRGLNKSAKPCLPLVAVNTTAGTGSECTRAYVVVDEKTGEKYGNKDRNALVSIAVNDHELMMNLPKGLTAGTGMDALTHAVEAYTSRNAFVLSSELALAAIRQVFACLEAAVLESTEPARSGMAIASYLAGLAFGNSGCGLVHSMSHQLSAVYDLPHGLCNAILLPVVMRFNAQDAGTEEKYAEIARAMFPLDCQNKTTMEQAEILVARIEALSQRIGTLQTLAALGVKTEDVSLLAEKALLDGSLPNNPVQPSKEEIEELYKVLL